MDGAVKGDEAYLSPRVSRKPETQKHLKSFPQRDLLLAIFTKACFLQEALQYHVAIECTGN